MAIFLSAGHNPIGIRPDPGAIAHGKREADLTIELRDLVLSFIEKSYRVITDKDCESLSDYLKRIEPGEASVVLEFHFDAFNGNATGSTSIVGTDADKNDKNFAEDLVNTTASTLGIKNRGVKCESTTHRKRLGLMRKKGIVSLLEVCFIDNKADMAKYEEKKRVLAKAIALILMTYDDLM